MFFYPKTLKVYQFIASNWDLKEALLALGVADIPVCSSNLVSIENFNSLIFFQKQIYLNILNGITFQP